MVKRLAILALLGLTAFASASESGVLSGRAQRSLSAGKYVKAYNQLERALVATHRESDLLSEGRILIALAQIRTQSLNFDIADSLLAMVRKEALDVSTKTNLESAKIALLNAREKYGDAFKICQNANADSIDESDDISQASFYAECAIASAGTRHKKETKKYLDQTGDVTDTDGGFYAYTAAQVAAFEGKASADSLFRIAEAKSIQSNKPYITATILYKRSQLKGISDTSKKDLKERCKNAFELMGLPKNAKRCGEK